MAQAVARVKDQDAMSLFPDPLPPPPKKASQQPDAIRVWEEAWTRHRASRFAWTTKDAVLVSKALKLAENDLALFQARVERLLSESEDEWLARNASPGLLVDRWNQLAWTPPKKPKVSPLPEYHPIPGPRIPPPSNLLQMFHEAKQRYAGKRLG